MTKGKRQPPLHLDMDFSEALERLGKTNIREVLELEKATADKKRAARTNPTALPDNPTKDDDTDR